MSVSQPQDNRPVATRKDIETVFGSLDEDTLLAILDLRPTVAELDEANLWLSGDRDVFGAEPPLKGVPSEIVTLLTAEEEDEH